MKARINMKRKVLEVQDSVDKKWYRLHEFREDEVIFWEYLKEQYLINELVVEND